MVDQRTTRVARLKEEWKAGLPEHTQTFDIPRNALGWRVTVGRGQNVHFLFNERVSEWLFEETSGHRVVARRFGPRDVDIHVAVQFKSDAEAVLFSLRWL